MIVLEAQKELSELQFVTIIQKYFFWLFEVVSGVSRTISKFLERFFDQKTSCAQYRAGEGPSVFSNLTPKSDLNSKSK